MTEIKIPFTDRDLERLAQGRKSCTSRRKKYGKVGDTFWAGGKTYQIKARQQYRKIWEDEIEWRR